MNIIEALMGKKYPKIESAVYADCNKVIVTVSRILKPDNVDLDSPTYIETKFKKLVPILTSIGVTKNEETDEQSINVTVEAAGKFNSIANLNHLAQIAQAIGEIAEERLCEPEIIKNIELDCKPFIDNEPEEAEQADA